MLNLKNIPIDKNKLIEKLRKYAELREFTVDIIERDNFCEIKFYNNQPAGLLRIYLTRKGVTVDGNTGKNKKLNQELISYINEITSVKEIKEKRINFKQVSFEDFEEILQKISVFSDGNKEFTITDLQCNNPSERRRIVVKDNQSKEEVKLTYYTNLSLYIHGFSWSIGEEIINIICKVTDKVNIRRINYLNEVVHDCNEAYIVDKGEECNICDNKCNGEHSKYLKEIHFGDRKRYNCDRIMNYYFPKYSYRYSFEIEKILNYYRDIINQFQDIHVLSVGCGPCTELMGIASFNSQNKKTVKYNGIDLNHKWKSIHDRIINKFDDSYKLNFYYKDVFQFINQINPQKKQLHSNIVIFQYVLSDMKKYKSKDEIYFLFKRFHDEIFQYLPKGALVVCNDINHKEKVRDLYDLFETILPQGEYHIDKYHFITKTDSYYKYGNGIVETRVPYYIPEYIDNRYNPWITCNSAAFIIRKV
ncbi:hypothetical protein SAMN05660297_02450 [Natronincola peptidivorans]|uniref:Methyltransferase domain-containing protein n=1 Tax=Natronincola peptidivorans TaxID=426128 RepID=A0A1I0EJK6_9FIRM|nr:hypothetical protein [Natronincola peptidivorans]SET45617.1 hypothetical protein SAMN05660297_02450 [Natronincola peptidivorans]